MTSTLNNAFGYGPGTLSPVTGNLDVLGNLHVFGTSQLDGAVTTGSNLTVGGNAAITGTLNVTNASSFGSTATFNNVHVQGNTQMDVDATVGGLLNVGSDATFSGDIIMSNGVSRQISLNGSNKFETTTSVVYNAATRTANFANGSVAFGTFVSPNPGQLTFTSTSGGLGTLSNPGQWVCPETGYYLITFNLILNEITAFPTTYGSATVYMIYNGVSTVASDTISIMDQITVGNRQGCSATFQGVLNATDTILFFGGTSQDLADTGRANGTMDVRITRLF